MKAFAIIPAYVRRKYKKRVHHVILSIYLYIYTVPIASCTVVSERTYFFQDVKCPGKAYSRKYLRLVVLITGFTISLIVVFKSSFCPYS